MLLAELLLLLLIGFRLRLVRQPDRPIGKGGLAAGLLWNGAERGRLVELRGVEGAVADEEAVDDFALR